MDDLRQMFTREFWDERYAGADRIWSGRPNQRLVEQVGDLVPADGATALDVGCGEGADAVWLAERGWRVTGVTGVDVSPVALTRAARHAADAGVDGRVSWSAVDLVAGEPLPGAFDLVTASYLHVLPEDLARVWHAVTAAVAPGGTLVVTAHHPADAHLRNPALAHLMLTPDVVVGLLDPAAWTVAVAEVQQREQLVEGEPVRVTDTVVRATRR